MRSILLVILTVLSLGISAQSITTTISRNSILIGDQIYLNVEVETGKYAMDGLLIDGMQAENAIEIVRPGELGQNENSGLYEQQILITSFDSGTHYVPPVGAILSDGNFVDTIYSRKIPLMVNTVAPDSIGLAPVKPIIEEEKKWTDYVMYFIPVLLLLLLALGFWWWSRRKDQVESRDIEVPLPAPEVEAREALKKVEDEQLWLKGEIKEFETRISMIMRRFVERKMGFPAMEWTTREIINFLGEDDRFSVVPVTVLQDVLSTADLVKYAKSDPGVEAHVAQIRKSEEFIRITQNFELEEEE